MILLISVQSVQGLIHTCSETVFQHSNIVDKGQACEDFQSGVGASPSNSRPSLRKRNEGMRFVSVWAASIAYGEALGRTNVQQEGGHDHG